ncbi:MAG: 2-hydroxyacyl-CoA dehydratase family protein [Armatimonadota bacterium]|nr:2-hydroxyacyl-CoA dehydratase family protein [Armatimonadota bacterium]MCX7778100.1 2-hydroxyacyl-CoA dehydratase family protein [Armatimonadota bacterium]MDW8026161.1 2-hydroxyacyl-CoA dehydratase family protein [Armatimonadota bacterium]
MGAIAYFEEIVTTDKRIQELKESSQTVVGIFCNFVPEEVIYGLSAIPVRLCSGDIELARVGEEVFPRDVCSLVKASVGMAVSNNPLFELVDLVVIPTPCDAKKKLCSILSSYKQVHVLQLPPSKHEIEAQLFWIEQVWKLKSELERLTGKKLSKNGLKDAILLLNSRNQAFMRLLEIRKLIPPVISGKEALMVTIASFYDDVERWIKMVHLLCEELEAKYNHNQFICDNSAPRVLIIGAPLIYPNLKLMDIVESNRAIVVIDDLCSGTQRLYQPVIVKEWSMKEMIRAIAERTLLPSMCPCFVENYDRINRVHQLVEEFQIDGVIYHNLRICPLFDIESALIYNELKRRNIPCLVLSTDYTYEDTQQIRNRVEAFFEMILSRIAGSKRSGYTIQKLK